ncbi:MAG: hypothetical protein U0Z75_10205 [Deinococcaceae bacterium]
MNEISKTPFECLIEFHEAFGQPVAQQPTLPAQGTLQLRKRLLQEEFAEVCVEIERLESQLETPGSIPDQLYRLAHELADLLYVTYGTFAALGIDPQQVFAEIHRANMRKITGDIRPDGKRLKPKNFVPADIHAVIQSLVQAEQAQQEGR